MNFLNVFNHIVEHGGATYNMTTGELNPDSGYMVAQREFEQVFDFYRNSNVFSEQIKSYLTKKVVDQLICRSDIYLGFWLKDDKIYFDVVRRMTDRNEAILEGRRNKQIAIYDANEKKDIEVHLGRSVSNDSDLDF
jgi:hypothetical protein